MAKIVRKRKQEEPDFLPKTRRIAVIALDHKAKDVRAYDVRELTVIADSFVICTVTSEPQFKAVCNAVRSEMKEIGVAPLRTEGTYHGGWYVIDYGAVIVHVFREEARTFYDLDGLWGDAPEVHFE